MQESTLSFDKQSFFCPVCQNHVSHFMPLDPSFGIQAKKHGFKYFGQGEMTAHETYSCPKCTASDRERLYAFWIREQINTQKLHSYCRILHFAPERALSKFLQHMGIFKYYETSDPLISGANHKYDLTAITRPANSVDFFICSHVLEHVSDDRKAVSELYRITAKEGFGILMAPIMVGLEKTHEDPKITSEAERWKYFGQGDHVRLYAHDDYVNLLCASGFDVTLLNCDQNIVNALGLKPTSILYIVRK